jgi:hypothetical protein
MEQKPNLTHIKEYTSRDGWLIKIVKIDDEDPLYPVAALVYPKDPSVFGGGHLIHLTRDLKGVPDGITSYDYVPET